MTTQPIAWLNGRMIPFASAAVPVWDMGVVAGASVTEMARTYRHKPFRLSHHVERFTGSLRALRFPEPWTVTDLTDAAMSIVQHNAAMIGDTGDLGIVLFSTAGSNPTYLSGASDQTTTVVHTFELPFHLWKPALMNGVRLRIPDIRQLPESSFPVSHKVRNRLHWWLADQEANRLEPGSRALLLDSEGFVTETSTSCFFVVRDGKIATSSRGVLRSLSGQLVEDLAGSLGISFERRPISSAELETADEAFLSSTPVGLLPVSHIDGRSLGLPDSSGVFRQLVSAWDKLTGVASAEQILQR